MGFDDLNKNQKKLIESYLQAILTINQTVNLTRIDSYESAFLLHIEDSLTALPEITKAPNGLYGDLGSGGGFPGVPLAIASNKETYLIEMRQKKMLAVAKILNQLKLNKQIHTYIGRAELLARSMPGGFAVLTARALAKLPILLELASPLLKNNGILIAYKSEVEDFEYHKAEQISEFVGMELISDRTFLLTEANNSKNSKENNIFKRRLLVFQKITQSKIQLPRKEGMAQKNPL